MAMTVELPALERTDAMTQGAASSRLRRYAGPALGLLLPVGLALVWEVVVAQGWSSGRLVPPPTKVFATIVALAKSGELSRHIIATLTRVASGFVLGVAAGTLLGAISGYWGLAGGYSIRRCRRCAPFHRLPGCRCSFCGSAFSKPRKSR
jgi:sulfonate transport system permease protein